MANQSPETAAELGKLLLTAGIGLLKAGAGSSRINTNIVRLASAYGYQAEIDLSTRSITVSLHTRPSGLVFSGTSSMSTPHEVNFKIISGISRLSWTVIENNMILSDTRIMLEKVLALEPYNRFIVLGVVGLAGASFCYMTGGNSIEMGVAFLATVAGMLLKQELNRKSFNPYLITFCSALLAALVVGIFWKTGIESRFEHAFETCILFLIPGVQLINSIMDLIDGYIVNGIDRGVNASIHAFTIAAGLATALSIFQIYK